MAMLYSQLLVDPKPFLTVKKGKSAMPITPALIFSLAAIVVMLYCLYQVISLKKQIPGGVVGKKWNTLSILVVLFTLAYLATPFLDQIPAETLGLFISAIFFFGAIYVLITIKLIHTIIRALSE